MNQRDESIELTDEDIIAFEKNRDIAPGAITELIKNVKKDA